MRLRTFILSFVLVVTPLTAIAKDQAWVRVNTSHFVIVSDAGEKQARRIGDQFERMRAVFHKAFPNASVDAPAPIIVIAVRDKKGFRDLEPEAYLAKGQLDLGGLFLQTLEKDFILLRLDVEGEHPYSAVYHEYTHFILRKASDWMPLWLNEGWAQFYENTEIMDKEVSLGKASASNLMLLRQYRPLPLSTLLAVDQNSPYYHEENKGSIFYAESWALAHYLILKDKQDKTDRLGDYLKLVNNNVDSVTAASRAFGDLKLLEKNLERYISQANFYYFKMAGPIEVDDSKFQVQSLTLTQADAMRAEFLAYNQRAKDARTLLDRVLKDDPNNVTADETMGYMAFSEGNFDEAGKWYEKAVKLDSQSFLAYYYFAGVAMREASSAERNAQIEASLRSSIKLNPAFAPSLDLLAAFYGMQRKNLDEAAKLSLQAIELDHTNIQYRSNRANLLMAMGRLTDAESVLKTALKLPLKPEEIESLQNQLQSINAYQASQESMASANQSDDVEEEASVSQTSGQGDETAAPVLSQRPEPELHGPRRTVLGTLRSVHCTSPAVMGLKVEGGKTPVALRAKNYYKVQYLVLGYKPSADMNPCKDLEGATANVEYFEGRGGTDGQIISITLEK